MKKSGFQKLIFSLSVLLLTALPLLASYRDGDGTVTKPYQIADVAGWTALRNDSTHWNNYFILTADIDFGGDTITPVAPDTSSSIHFQGTQFTGQLDGNGHILKNFVINQSGDFAGLFGYLGSGSQIKNLGIENGTIAGKNSLGGLCGYNDNGTIMNCYASGTVTGSGDYVGGLCGYNLHGTITKCCATNAVTGYRSVGGLCGYNSSGTVTSCCATNAVTGNRSVGGLCGWNDYGTITNCYATGAVTGSNEYMGGLCGANALGTITNCYAAGVVTGLRKVGGLCGGDSGTITGCFWDKETSKRTDSAGGTGLTTAQMYDSGLFIADGWDFTDNDGDPADWLQVSHWYQALAWESGVMVTVPNIAALPRNEAEALLLSAGLSLGTVSYVFSDTIASELVISQSLPAGDRTRRGVRLDLVVSLGMGYSGGDGTVTNPYQISDKVGLSRIQETPSDNDNYFILTADIDLTGLSYSKACIAPDNDNATYDFQGTAFTGVFDGNGHTILNLTINNPSNDYLGLFGYIGVGGQVKNLGVANGTINGSYYVGGLCGWNKGVVTNCYATGAVTGDDYNAGGLCGQNSGGTITNCYATCAVTGYRSVGGLCGYNSGAITTSYATGEVTGMWMFTGGLCGDNSGTITGCFWDKETSKWTTSKGGTGLTTVQMQDPGLFIADGWDFTDSDGDPADWLQVSHGYQALAWESGFLVTIPDIAALPRNEAEALLLSAGLGLGMVAYDYSDTIASEHVISQSIPAGYHTRPGEMLDMVVSLGNGYAGGDGTKMNPYRVSDLGGLLRLQKTPALFDKCFILTADIDLTGLSYTKACIAPDNDNETYDFQGTAFTGVFDGNGHSILNLTINNPSNSYLGLFGYIGVGGQVKNLGLAHGTINGRSYIGGLCGRNKGAITNCYATGAVMGTNKYDSHDSVGGLCGENWYGTITSCYATGTVTGFRNVGGLCGRNDYGTITNCYATGAVTGNTSSSSYVGGLCGLNSSGMIMNCYATGAATVSNDTVGGLCGGNALGTITNCYATGAVTGFRNVGGLCGENDKGTITNCYATGAVTGNVYVGGLCGFNFVGRITSCFWDTQSSGQSAGFGWGPITGVTGKTTLEMQTLSTFTSAGWDFSDTDGDPADWKLVRPGKDYPRLAWQQEIPGDVAGLWGVDAVDLVAMVSNWQNSNPSPCDLNQDGTVNLLDFALISENWLSKALSPADNP